MEEVVVIGSFLICVTSLMLLIIRFYGMVFTTFQWLKQVFDFVSSEHVFILMWALHNLYEYIFSVNFLLIYLVFHVCLCC